MIFKKILICAFLGELCEALNCYTCSYQFDNNGNQIGTGDETCYTGQFGLNSLITECFADAEFCGSELIADWLPTGEQQFKFSRGCRTTNSPNACTSGSLTGMRYKDCITTCSSDACNSQPGPESDVAMLFAKVDSSGKPVDLECYSCNSERDEDQNLVDGKSDCYSTPTNENSQRQCPIFANQACFKAKTLVDNGNEFHFKGCSAFDLDGTDEYDEPYCNEATVQQSKIVGCRSLCEGDNCNTLSVTGSGLMCNTCSTTFNHLGFPIGWGDMACFQDLAERHLEFCAPEVTTCVTQFEADWRFNGQQTFTMTRGCGTANSLPNNLPSCLTATGPNDNYHIKECLDICDNSGTIGCNNNTDVTNSFSQGGVKSCKSCSDHLTNPNADSDCAKDDNSMSCPNFADAACFSSQRSTQSAGIGGTYQSDTYHGCSAFRVQQDSKTCFNIETDSPDFGNPEGNTDTQSICKETCTDKDDCNTELTSGNPDQPIGSEHFCYSCSITVDHFNNSVGLGQEGCWEHPGDDLMIACPQDYNFCVTDMEVDWMSQGDQWTTVRRSCSPSPASETCRTGNIGPIYQYKDCAETCTDNLITPCNGDLHVAGMFIDLVLGQVRSCFNCETHSNDDSCGDLSGPDASRAMVKCPDYANVGCFTSIRRTETDGNNNADDVIRGCSSFVEEYACAVGTQSNADDGTSNSFTTCKEACTDLDNCNGGEAVVATSNMCYVCSVTIDQEGNQVGFGDYDCINANGAGINDTYLWDCGKDSQCSTRMEALWLPMGSQQMHIERHCGVPMDAASSGNGCMASSSNAWSVKDCWETCEGEKCNVGIDSIVKNFAPPSGSPTVDECYTCSFEEIGAPITNNPIVDQNNCKEKPTELTKTKCPPWATGGCFVGDGVQLDDDKNEIVNVYRGCSSFYREDNVCSALTLDTNVEAGADRTRTSICKQVCNDSDDCNTIRYPGWEDAGEDECPEDCIQPTPPVSTDEPITITDPVNPPTTTGTSATKAGFTVFAIITAVMTLF